MRVAQAGGSCCCSSLLLHAPIPNATMTVLDGSCTITAPQGRSLPQLRRRRVQRKWATLCLSILHISPCSTRHKHCCTSVLARREWYVRLASCTGHRTQRAAEARSVDCCLFTSRALVDHQAHDSTCASLTRRLSAVWTAAPCACAGRNHHQRTGCLAARCAHHKHSQQAL